MKGAAFSPAASTTQVLDAPALTAGRGLGPAFRRRSPGPESDLVEWFLSRELIRAPSGHRLTIFREPRLPTGFPDIVVVVWAEAVAMNWNSARKSLRVCDLRLMHLLVRLGRLTPGKLGALIPGYKRSMGRLLGAGMVEETRGGWKADALHNVFAASQIIAVEAKVCAWRAALDQAHLNTWFASRSCVLVPRVPRGSTLLRDARNLGLSVIARERTCRALTPTGAAAPRSYASWLFNEWAWRASLE